MSLEYKAQSQNHYYIHVNYVKLHFDIYIVRTSNY